MLITVNKPTFMAEVATTASTLPYRHSVDANRRLGQVLALTGRYAR
jgi:hypothetical protein